MFTRSLSTKRAHADGLNHMNECRAVPCRLADAASSRHTASVFLHVRTFVQGLKADRTDEISPYDCFRIAFSILTKVARIKRPDETWQMLMLWATPERFNFFFAIYSGSESREGSS